MLHDNTRWSRVSEQNSADGVLRRHRELPMLQLLGAYGQANFRMIPHCNRAVLIGRKIARVIGSGICMGASRGGVWDLNTDRRMLRFLEPRL
jgi:hypothetical protein